jgi:hypothetical protein
MSHNYTYLELVNAVLVRLREDTVATVQGTDDVVVSLVKEFVNDAKRTVEDAHTWSALSKEWEVSTTIGNDKLVLTDSHKSPIIDYIYDDRGMKLTLSNKESLRRKAAMSGEAGTPTHYIVDGTEANGDTRLRIWPAPKAVSTYTAYGYERTAPLSLDSDMLAVPAAPVIYLAEALAARERGEIGGLASSELLMLAKQYLSDAIAMDATNNDMDNNWYTV